MFIYDSIDLINASVQAGTMSGTTFTPNSGAVTDEIRMNDQSIGSDVTSFDYNDAVRFDLGSSKAADVFAIYQSAEDNEDYKFYGSDSPTATGSEINDTSLGSAGWNYFTFSATKRYWFIESGATIINYISEIIIGKKLDFEVSEDVNIEHGVDHGVDLQKSYGGVEYAIKRHASKKKWKLTWSNISNTFKSDLESMRDTLSGNYQPFVYYDGSSYHWVRMTGLEFAQVAYNRWSTSITLVQQLS
jgi:hypothetical protein